MSWPLPNLASGPKKALPPSVVVSASFFKKERTSSAMSTTCLITGATGFVGGHLAEACVKRGMAVRGLARPGGDVSALEACGATVVRGDLTDVASVRAALEGAEVVFHCAAKVGDWGPVEDYRAVNVEALRGLPGGVPRLALASLRPFQQPGRLRGPPPPRHRRDGAAARTAHGRLHAEQGGVRTTGVTVPARTGRAGGGVAARFHLRAARPDGAAEPDRQIAAPAGPLYRQRPGGHELHLRRQSRGRGAGWRWRSRRRWGRFTT